MTATATIRRIENFGGSARTARHGALTVLRGAAWKMGWLLAGHGLAGTGDRLMPYPTGGFNNALTAANGGPLQVPGADANGGLRIIANAPNVSVVVLNATAAAVQVTVSGATGYIVGIFPILASTTADEMIDLIRGHALANRLLRVVHTGTGAGLMAALGTSAVPYVRIAGISGGEADNTADVVNDNDLRFGSNAEQVYMGRLGMQFSDVNSAHMMAPQKVWAVDNATVQGAETALCLPMWCSSFEDDLAICEIK